MRAPESEHHGVWWLPSHPSTRLPGVLRILDDHRFQLEIFGIFPEVSYHLRSTMFGEADGDRAMSLYGVDTVSNSHYGPGGFGRSTFEGQVCLIGAAFNSFSEIRFTSMSVDLAGLVEWLRPRDWLTCEEGDGSYLVLPRKADLKTDCSASIDGLEISLRSSPIAFAGSTDRRISFSQTAILEIGTNEDRELNVFLEEIARVRHLVTLCTQRRPELSGLWAKTSPTGGRLQFGGHSDLMTAVFIQGWTGGQSKRASSPWSTLIGAEEVAPQFAEFYPTWHKHAKELPAVHSLFFSSWHASELPADVRFLNLTQCIEAYARTRLGAHYVDRAAWMEGPYKSLVQAIPAGLDESHRNALTARLQWGHAHSLRRMVENLVGSLPAVERHLIRCPGVFADDVVDFRNGLIHLSEDLPARAKSLPSLNELTLYLEIVLTCRFLSDLGATDERIESQLTSGSHFLSNALKTYYHPKRSHYRRPHRT